MRFLFHQAVTLFKSSMQVLAHFCGLLVQSQFNYQGLCGVILFVLVYLGFSLVSTFPEGMELFPQAVHPAMSWWGRGISGLWDKEASWLDNLLWQGPSCWCACHSGISSCEREASGWGGECFLGQQLHTGL